MAEPKEIKEYKDPQYEKMHFKDSWLQNTVELAALGTILTGAGTLAVKGDLGSAFRQGQKGFKALGKGFENYLKRRGSLGQKFTYNVGKKTFENLRKRPKPTTGSTDDLFQSIIGPAINEVDNNPAIQARIRKEVARRLSDEQARKTVDKALDGKTNFPSINQEERARQLFEEVRAKERDQLMQSDQVVESTSQNKRTNNKRPFNKKEFAKELTTTGLTGLAFGAGISGFHALDRLSSDQNVQKKLEDTYQYAGSFLNKKEENNSMKKQAGSLELYNSLKGLGRKTPESIMGGLGFTGVSLGTAKLMNNQTSNKDDDQPSNKSTRVIIELGENSEKNTPKNNSSLPMGLSSLPRVDHHEKTAAPIFNRLKQFGRDLKGYEPKIDELRNVNPADVAAERLKNEDVSSLVNKQYGNLANSEYNQNQFRGKLFDSYTQKAKTEIDDEIRGLQNQTAKARLQAGAGGLTLAGGGLAALSAAKRPREEQP